METTEQKDACVVAPQKTTRGRGVAGGMIGGDDEKKGLGSF